MWSRCNDSQSDPLSCISKAELQSPVFSIMKKSKLEWTVSGTDNVMCISIHLQQPKRFKIGCKVNKNLQRIHFGSRLNFCALLAASKASSDANWEVSIGQESPGPTNLLPTNWPSCTTPDADLNFPQPCILSSCHSPEYELPSFQVYTPNPDFKLAWNSPSYLRPREHYALSAGYTAAWKDRSWDSIQSFAITRSTALKDCGLTLLCSPPLMGQIAQLKSSSIFAWLIPKSSCLARLFCM